MDVIIALIVAGYVMAAEVIITFVGRWRRRRSREEIRGELARVVLACGFLVWGISLLPHA